MPSTNYMEADRGGRKPSVAFSVLESTGVRRAIALVPVLAVLLGSCDFDPESLRREIREGRSEEVGPPGVDPSETDYLAGVSVLRLPGLRPLNPSLIGADTTTQGFHRYVHRCGGCHATPDPSIRTSSQWEYVVPRMEGLIRDLGLIPLSHLEKPLILGFLERHAAKN